MLVYLSIVNEALDDETPVQGISVNKTNGKQLWLTRKSVSSDFIIVDILGRYLDMYPSNINIYKNILTSMWFYLNIRT